MSTPLSIALGYGWTCPYCGIAQDEGRQTGRYYMGKAVCVSCAPILGAARSAASSFRTPFGLQCDAAPYLLAALKVATSHARHTYNCEKNSGDDGWSCSCGFDERLRMANDAILRAEGLR